MSANVAGSVGVTPYRSVDIGRVNINAATSPITTPYVVRQHMNFRVTDRLCCAERFVSDTDLLGQDPSSFITSSRANVLCAFVINDVIPERAALRAPPLR